MAMHCASVRQKRVHKFALFILGDAADSWLNAPHRGLAGARPIDHARENPRGLREVERLLVDIYNKSFALSFATAQSFH